MPAPKIKQQNGDNKTSETSEASKTGETKTSETSVSAGAGSAEVQKVAPYPIDVSVMKTEGEPLVLGQIVKLTEIGFLMKVDASQFYRVGESRVVQFSLPVIGTLVSASVVVVKTYGDLAGPGASKVTSRTIEMHFRNLSAAHKAQIETYLVKSGQKKN
jgi:hypothetical protein